MKYEVWYCIGIGGKYAKVLTAVSTIVTCNMNCGSGSTSSST
jgi:hypothetical protein